MKDPTVYSFDSNALQSERPWARQTATTLLQRVRANERDSWQRLADLYGPWVYAIGRRSGLTPDDAADVTQETFRAVHHAIGRFDHDSPGSSFRGWLKQITINKVRDHWRLCGGKAAGVGGTGAYVRLHQLPAPPESTSVESEANDADPQEAELQPHEVHWLYQRAIELARRDFTATTWQAFWQTAVEERDPAIVAADLGLTRNAVYVAKSRVLSRLRAELCEIV